MRQINLSAGPSALPIPVLERLSSGILEFEGSGVGIFELGHRTSLFEGILAETKKKILSLLAAPLGFEVLFCTGGATQQFAMVPLNISASIMKPAAYIVSGHWSKAALAEASKFREVITHSSTEPQGFKCLPAVSGDFSNYSYLHFTSNNTIYGTQFKSDFDITGAPLVCDASSDIFSRVLDLNKYDMIYAGAQKNLGTAGVTIVIIRSQLIEEAGVSPFLKLPQSMSYYNYLKGNSNSNTPPVSAILATYEMLKWMEEEGGVSEMEKRSIAKSEIVFSAISESGVFKLYPEAQAASRVNITFRAENEDIEKKFVEFARSKNIIGIEGHRSVKGLRASFYNAASIKDAEIFAESIKDFSKK